jgi:hypothetical protein
VSPDAIANPSSWTSPNAVLTIDAANNIDSESYFSMAIDDDNLLDCFINLPSSEGLPFILNYATIADAQAWDAKLMQKAQQHPQCYVQQLLAPGILVYCYISEPHVPWKMIYRLPQELVNNAI